MASCNTIPVPLWILLNIAALGLALAVIFSCFSPSTSDIHIMSASPIHLVNGLQAFINGGATILNQSEAQSDSAFLEFELSALPDKYLFGVTGVCRQYFSDNTISCSRRFGQNPSILPVILSDLTSSSTAGQSWTSLLVSSGISSDQQVSSWQQLSTASAALLVCSIASPCIAVILIILDTPSYFVIIIASDLFSGVTAVAAASMWTNMFVNCTSQYLSGTSYTSEDYRSSHESLFGFPANDSGPDLQSAFVYGPGLPILWVAAGSHVTILVITVVAAIIYCFFIRDHVSC